ncbi:hypothetical protein [Candidatus Leptofilum sp.]|uniref:hypothetical protein n=1 Tax=Candidatus Leptofilum sp. TaxID=3241576 RepID=UPI003B58C7B3
MNPALDHIAQTLAADLGSQLEAVFLFGSQTAQQVATAVSDTNFLVITQPETNIQNIRQSFAPLWQEHKMLLKRGPLVTNRHTLLNHLHLNPQLALNLLQHGQQLAGDPLSLDLFRTPTNPYEIYAHLTQQLLDASAALVPNSDPDSKLLLNRLFRQISNQPTAAADTAVIQFSTIQQALTAVLNKLPAAKMWQKAAQRGSTSPNIPGLQAIYTESKRNIFVFNQLTPRQISQINWQTLAQHLPDADASLHITTVAQFCLIALYDKALDLRFNKYQHKWGINFLAKLTPSSHQILRQAARVPSQILVDALPHSILTASNNSDDTLHKLIHDYQNQMLNVQLENELLFRLGLIPEKFTPPEPLPERDVSAKLRLDAIFQHLGWWADFYQTALQTPT